MVVYISGKITGTNDFASRFNNAEVKLKQHGYDVLNPVSFNKDIPDDASWEDYMKNCLQYIAKADAIYMLDGWRMSKGANIEHRIAMDLGIRVLYEKETHGSIMNREQAINYLRASGMTDEQIQAVVNALSISTACNDQYEQCWQTGEYVDQECAFCRHRFECSGSEVDDE